MDPSCSKFKPLLKCETSTLRRELQMRNLPYSGTRTQLLDILNANNVNIIECFNIEKKPVESKPQPIPFKEKDTTFTPKVYTPTSPYIPCASMSRSNELLTDAAYTILKTHNIKSVRSLFVANIDVIGEIKDIKVFKNKLVEDYITLRNDVEHLKFVLQNTLNRDLYMYNIANEIAWALIADDIHFEMPVQIINPRFFGKVEDTIVHGNLHFEIEFTSNANLSDGFIIDLPIAYDAVLDTCPIMVLVYSNYDVNTGTYASESTTCHAYIQKNDPSKMYVYCPSLIDYNRLQFDITLRYFGKLQPSMISPRRFSSIHYQQDTSERGHNVYHHWSELDDRIELFTNIEIVASMDGIDEIRVKLPIICSDEKYIDVVGYGIVNYTITSDVDNTIIYSTNTPLVSISQSDTSMLYVKSALMLNINNYSSMNVATHIIYTKKTYNDVIQNFRVNQIFTLPSNNVDVSFNTTYAINTYYFTSIQAIVNNVYTYDIPITALHGFQQTWTFRWTVPDSINNNAIIKFKIRLYEKEYVTSNEALLMEPLRPSDVKISIVNIGSHDITYWLESIDTTLPVPYDVNVQAIRKNGTVDHNRTLSSPFTKDSERVWIQMTNLIHSTFYTLQIIFTDPLNRQTKIEVNQITRDIESD